MAFTNQAGLYLEELVRFYSIKLEVKLILPLITMMKNCCVALSCMLIDFKKLKMNAKTVFFDK